MKAFTSSQISILIIEIFLVEQNQWENENSLKKMMRKMKSLCLADQRQKKSVIVAYL